MLHNFLREGQLILLNDKQIGYRVKNSIKEQIIII